MRSISSLMSSTVYPRSHAERYTTPGTWAKSVRRRWSLARSRAACTPSPTRAAISGAASGRTMTSSAPSRRATVARPQRSTTATIQVAASRESARTAAHAAAAPQAGSSQSSTSTSAAPSRSIASAAPTSAAACTAAATATSSGVQIVAASCAATSTRPSRRARPPGDGTPVVAAVGGAVVRMTRRPYRAARGPTGRCVRRLRRGGGGLRGGDQVANCLRVARTQQRDRVGLAVDDALEELLAVLVRRQRALRPAAHVVEHHGERGVLLAEQLGDLGLHALRERGRGARGGDRDRERAGAEDRRQDEVAQRRHVDDVDEHRALLGVVVDADVHVGAVRRRDDHERALEVRGLVVALLPADRALARELLQLGHRVGRDERHVAVAGEQALDLLEADLPAADDEALAARELQAGDVEGRREHVADAGLVADSAPELADALLPGVGGSWHGPQRVEVRTLCTAGDVSHHLLHERVDDPPRPARVRRRALGAADAAHAGGASRRVHGFLRAHGRARRPLRP